MIMTETLADELMNCLCRVYISANGGYDPDTTEENFDLAKEYAINKFTQILSEWEDLKNEEWDIIPSD